MKQIEPLLRIDLVQKVRLVPYCDFQPNLMGESHSAEVVFVKDINNGELHLLAH